MDKQDFDRKQHRRGVEKFGAVVEKTTGDNVEFYPYEPDDGEEITIQTPLGYLYIYDEDSGEEVEEFPVPVAISPEISLLLKVARDHGWKQCQMAARGMVEELFTDPSDYEAT